MFKRKGPYITLIILVIVLFFILGFRAGQGVEKKNKTVSAFLSIPPSRPPEATVNPLQFKLYSGEDCGIEFLYPASLSLDKRASLSAEFSGNGRRILTVSCAPKNNLLPTSVPGKPEEFIRTQKITWLDDKNDFMRFQLNHPTQNYVITFVTEKSLFPLIKRSLDFMK